MSIALGIDALDLLRDRRGMGRFARGVVRCAIDDSRFTVSLVVRDPAARTAYEALLERDRFTLVRPREARTRFDVLWAPWNGVRFSSRAPIAVTIHDTFAFSFPHRERIARWREQRPIRRAARLAARIITDSSASREGIVRDLGVDPARITVIPLAPDPFWSPGPPTRTPVPPPFVLVAGGLEQRKNVAFLVRAHALAFPDRDVRLAVAGELPPLDDTVRAAVDLINVQPEDVTLRDLYRTAAAVAVPSLAEGFGLVAVEAQACGAAVVASDATSLPEAAGDAALYASPTDLEAWAEALRRAVYDPAVHARLRARSLVRWGFARRDRPARETLALLVALANDPIDDRA